MTNKRTYFYDYILDKRVDRNGYDCYILCRFADCVHLHNQ